MDALSELFERHYRCSVTVARRILRSDDEALDAVQSAYLAAFRHFSSFRGEAGFNSWISRIVMNQCFAYLRGSEHRRVSYDLEAEGVCDAGSAFAKAEPTPEDLASRRELAAALSAAGERLPKRLRDVFILCCVSGFCMKEAADKLGLTVPAAKIRLFRAKRRVRSELERRLAMPAPRSRGGVDVSQTTRVSVSGVAA
jgi:RNA polymerase sigma-70 factor (ECF subfamily)